MTQRLVVRSAAEADIVQAALWYEQRAAGLGSEFLRAVDVVLAEIAPTPERFPVVHQTCRRALLRRFPYGIYFVPTTELMASWRACTRVATRTAGRNGPSDRRPHRAQEETQARRRVAQRPAGVGGGGVGG
jgi:toxin ParE1/3/4